MRAGRSGSRQGRGWQRHIRPQCARPVWDCSHHEMKGSMMKASALSICLMLGLVGDAEAHHSNAAYDLDHLRTMEGTVRQINWTNPHVSFVIEGDAKKGTQVGTWVFEAASPGVLSRSGWTKRSLQVGDQGVFFYGPLRD